MIRLWELGGKLCQQEHRWHTNMVRDVQLASHKTFLSAANDWWVTRVGLCMHRQHQRRYVNVT